MTTVFPTKKISLTLIEFAEPLMNEMGDDIEKSELEHLIELASGVWNACVLDDWHETGEHVDAFRNQLSSHPVGRWVINMLIERKRQHFGHDLRVITNPTVVDRDGELVVRAEARAPG